MIQRSACRVRHLVKSSILGSSKFKVGVMLKIALASCYELYDHLNIYVRRDLTYLPTCFLGVVSNGGDAEYADVVWNNLGFGLMPADYMYTTKCSVGEKFVEGKVLPYGNIELSPSAGVLNYGQGVIEGAKVCRGENGGILLFRPEQNAIRMQVGAERMCMPSPSVELFVDALKQTALANRRWIPPPGKGWLYIRPLLIGSGPILGVAPSPEYTFLLYASPFGNNYFKEGALNLYIEDEYHRASRGGSGGVKSITNYSPVLKALTKAKGRGFSDVLYLDSLNKRYIEEASSSNIFVVKVEERSILVEELMDVDEVFCTGTAVGVAPVQSITYQDKRVEYDMCAKQVSVELLAKLVGIQKGLIEDTWGWVAKIY
ncbi:hypothetical protein RJ640_020430 [Escallonia rubra]|uniref:Branched-chain-amino-acid aminotransferase n=1 Tax=Escallonia rubra TaxID=112253 RepID=A0AA88S880_9ASTE|nr:hypothetical protein RJ640_020430 [Escallonia rubra]